MYLREDDFSSFFFILPLALFFEKKMSTLHMACFFTVSTCKVSIFFFLIFPFSAYWGKYRGARFVLLFLRQYLVAQVYKYQSKDS